jgi:hypothetical protein
MPERIQLRRTKGWRLPEGAMKVDRSTRWGNPFVPGHPSGLAFQDGGDPTPLVAAMTLQQSLRFYRDMVSGFLSPEMHPHGHEWMERFRARFGRHPLEIVRCDLRGRDLACWCPLDQPCHADVLLELANREGGG